MKLLKKTGIVLMITVFLSGISMSVSASEMMVEVNPSPTIDEIVAKYLEEELPEPMAEVYDEVYSVTSPYSSGSLSDDTLENALEVVNYIRYIAGLDSVILNDTYNQYAQDACLINALNGSLSHYPEQPDGVSDELYTSAYYGASRSNIGWGYSNIYTNIISGYMSDSDASNISRVGHRRWLLNPSLGEIGFGKVGLFTATYVVDYSNTEATNTGVAWPATSMPLELFANDDPWSFSVGETVSGSVTVTLTRGDEVWNFDESDTDVYGEFFTVDNTYRGQLGCVIFRPYNVTYNDGDIFQVEIREDGQLLTSYEVEFFDLSDRLWVLLGDVNEDDDITVTDIMMIYKHINEVEILSEEQQDKADVNEDGLVNVTDIMVLYKHINEVDLLF